MNINNKLKPITFTLLIACKDEENDVHLAIESAIAQTYQFKEIICVDDSSDRTKEIIEKYVDWGVLLIDGRREGCCMARNLGIERATGDVIVFLTADTKLKPNYLEEILPYYERGYDWVTVESYSYNTESMYSRFVEMLHRYEYGKPGFDPFTTQGYSVRRDAAIAVGLISGEVYPFNTCRDWTLGQKLTAQGYKKFFDRSIVVPHKSPDNFSEFWLVRKTRGLMSAYQPYFMFSRTPQYLFIKFVIKDFLILSQFILVVPVISRVVALACCSDRPFRYFPSLFFTYSMNVLAACVGEWQGLLRIIRLRRSIN